MRDSGISVVGNIPWGAHFCQFYRTQQDLIEILVPYFEAGLRSNESCLWVTSDILPAELAETLMVEALPEFKSFLNSGQMQIVPITQWYTADDTFNADATLEAWIERERESKARGFSGLRLTGDTLWVERSGWKDFMDYENKVNNAFRRYNLIALCTYCLNKCTAEDVIQVCCHHEFALSRRHGKWDLLESSSLKLAKDDLRELNAELESRVTARTNELNDALKARDQFLAMLGHELRNPLSSIRNASEIICSLTPSDSPVTPTAQILNRQVLHMTRLVDELLDVGRITQRHIQLQKEIVSISEIIEQAVEITRPFIDQCGHSLSVDIPDRVVAVLGDRVRLAQVFGNLLHNAAKYTKNGGHLSISAKINGEKIIIAVSDSGAGIPADKLPTIFNLFTQLPRSLERSDGGLGIGLTVVKEITEMHGGCVEATSPGLDKGSTFTVQLNLAPAMIRTADEPADIDSTGPSHVPRKILIIDDNADSSESLATLLQIANHDVVTAPDGLSGITTAETFAPEVILLDIGLPGMSGYEVARQLRLFPSQENLRIIAITGYGQKADLQASKEAGFDAHLVKPADPKELLNLIASLTKHEAKAQSAPLVFASGGTVDDKVLI